MVKINYKTYEATQRQGVHATVESTSLITESLTKATTERKFNDLLTYAANERLYLELET